VIRLPWLLNEDAAIKAHLGGLTVEDVAQPGGRPVVVRFRLPETELANMSFPLIVIEHNGIEKDSERESRGYTYLPYRPEGFAPVALSPDQYALSDVALKSEMPIPYNIDYLITVYSRKALHGMSLISALAQWDRLPARNGFLPVGQDGTVRRLDLLGTIGMEAAKDDDGKRIFRSIYAVRVSTELFQADIDSVLKVLSVSLDFDLNYLSDTYDVA
jgi:hypothetical protein